ncbi:hypothetical protein [Paenibacillus jiagnxiensis]
MQQVLEKAGIKPNIKFSAGDDYAIIAMVEKGLDISISRSWSSGQEVI